MNPTFSDAEYRRLMMLTFLGEWVYNAIRKEPDPGFEDVANKVYSYAKGTALEELITYDDSMGSWVPSDAFDEDAQTLIDEYDETTFWEELTARLTERDLIEMHGERGLKGMRPEQRSREASRVAKDYTHEFEDQGINRLHVTD